MALLHYLAEGDPAAPALVLLHPVGVDLTFWDPLALPLARHCRVVRIDLAGHGGSAGLSCPTIAGQAQAVAETMAALGLEGASIVGLSLGGMVAQRLALDAPRLVGRLVLACTSARTTPGVAALWRERAAIAGVQGMGSQVGPTMERWFTPDFAARRPQEVERVRGIFAAVPLQGYLAACSALAGLDQFDELAAITAPTLVVAGREDRALPTAVAEGLAARIPGARLLWLDAGHVAPLERAQEFVEAVTGFALNITGIAA